MQDLKELGEMTIKALESGMHIDSIVKSLMLSDGELNEIKDAFPEVRLLLRTGQMGDCTDLYDLVKDGAAPIGLYTHRAKTVYRSFHPQEEDTSDEDRIKASASAILDIVAKRTTN